MHGGHPHSFVSLYPPLLPPSANGRNRHARSVSHGSALAPPRDGSPTTASGPASSGLYTPQLGTKIRNGRFASPSGSPHMVDVTPSDGQYMGWRQRNAQAGPGPSSSSRPMARRTASQKFRDWDDNHPANEEVEAPSQVERRKHRGLLIVAEREFTCATTGTPTTGNSNSSRPFPSPGTLAGSSSITEADVAYLQRFAPNMEFSGEVTLSGYALFAVDKWVTSRPKLVKTVVAVSSEESHQLSTYLLTPRNSLTEEDAALELAEAVSGLRKDGARPIETPEGTLMVTSLPTLRQDLQTVFIHHGDYRLVQCGLYVNINLKRFGCGGRSSLSLDTPSAAIENKFLSLYRIPLPVSRPSFAQSVLELVKLAQTTLHICGLYGQEEGEEQDGLICERTGEGFKRWKVAFGRVVEHETGEAGALGEGTFENISEMPTTYLTSYGPAVFAALLTTITSTKYKLTSLNVDKVPRDPFTKVRAFKSALLNYQRYQSNRSVSPTEFLTPTLLEQINHDYHREKQQDATKLTRLIKHQVSQAGAGLASNLGALHLGGHHRYDDSGGSDGSDTDARSSRLRGSSADGRGSSSGGTSVPPDTISVSISSMLNTVLSSSRDKDAIITGRLRALYTGPIAPHHANPRDWHSILPPPSRNRVDLDSRELDIVEEEISPERRHHHHPHRLRVPERKGTIKNMTSRTGNAFRDVTGWARRGSLFAETSDSDSAPQSAGVSSDGRAQVARRMLLSLSLPHEPIEEESSHGSQMTSPPTRSHTLPIPGDNTRGKSQRRSATFNITAPSDQDSSRPTLASRANTLSFAGSESYAGGVSDYASVGGGNLDDDGGLRHPSEGGEQRPPIGERPSHTATKTRRTLYRMVSAECLAEADEDGVEFLHDGHGREAWDTQQKQKSAQRGILRSRSFSHAAEHNMLDFIPPDYLAIDVAYCALIDEMRHREKEMSSRVMALQKLETAVQEHFSAIVVEIRSRRARIDQLAALTEPLQLDAFSSTTPSIPMSTSASITMTPSTGMNPNTSGTGNGFNFHSLPSSQEPRPAQARRIQQQLELRNDRLSYSMKELERHVAGAMRLGEDVGVYVRAFLSGGGTVDGVGEGKEKGEDGLQGDGKEGTPPRGFWPRLWYKRE